jgi:periplasmic protein TonB
MVRIGIAAIVVALGTATALAAETGANVSAVQTRNAEFLLKHYPKRAIKNGEQGTVGFRASVSRHGVLESCEVTRSSGHPTLDAETCELIAKHANFEPARTSEGKTASVTHEGVVNWRLPGRSASVKAASLNPGSGLDPDKIICKSQVKTGSLVARTRQCLTRRQWIQATEEAQQLGRDLQRPGHADDRMVVGTSGG